MLLQLIKPFASTRSIVGINIRKLTFVNSRYLGRINTINSSSNIRHFSNSQYYFTTKKDDDAKHNIVPHQNQEISVEIYEKKEVISRRIPGETRQENDLKSRFPTSLNFEKEAIPTLLPRPGVPAPNKYPLARLYDALSKKSEPELIYEAEPHKLYFVFCYAFALLFIIYGINAFNIGYGLAWSMFEDNDMKLSDIQLKLQLAMHLSIVSVLAVLPLLAGIAFLFVPSRLVRRMWYLPPSSSTGNSRTDGQAFIKFTTHPTLPSRPTPVHIFPIGALKKSITSKIYSGQGFYGTTDASFFFFLRENGRRIPFIVDRKGFFWGDGRVFDLLFSDDSVEKVENAKKIDEIYGDLIRERKHKEMQMRKELGFGWRTKAGAKLLKEDIEKIKNLVSDKKVPTINSEESKNEETDVSTNSKEKK
jgi:hypothetical protein